MNILDLKRNSVIHETLLNEKEISILAIYAHNEYIKDEEVMKELGIKTFGSLKARISRIRALTGFEFERKDNYGYRLKNMLLINY